MHPDQDAEHPWLPGERALLADLIDHGVPLLGVCLGAQLVAGAAGAAVRRAPEPEIGWYEVRTTDSARLDPLLGPLSPGFEALEWHSRTNSGCRPAPRRSHTATAVYRRSVRPAGMGHPVPRRGDERGVWPLARPIRHRPGRRRDRPEPGSAARRDRAAHRRLERPRARSVRAIPLTWHSATGAAPRESECQPRHCVRSRPCQPDRGHRLQRRARAPVRDRRGWPRERGHCRRRGAGARCGPERAGSLCARRTFARATGWRAFVHGAAGELQRAGLTLTGAELRSAAPYLVAAACRRPRRSKSPSAPR